MRARHRKSPPKFGWRTLLRRLWAQISRANLLDGRAVSGKQHKDRKRHPWKAALNQGLRKPRRVLGKTHSTFNPDAIGKRMPWQ